MNMVNSRSVTSTKRDSVEDMMRYVHIDVDAIRDNYKQLVSARVEANEQEQILAELEQGLAGYTYLEDF